MFSKEIFGARLREIRTKTDTSQGDIAKALNTTKPTISKIESGQRAASIEYIWQLADYFNVSIDYLVGRSDDPKGGYPVSSDSR